MPWNYRPPVSDTSGVKICMDCAHYSYQGGEPTCTRKLRDEVNLINGYSWKRGLLVCEAERNSTYWDEFFGRTCGKRGQFFSSKM